MVGLVITGWEAGFATRRERFFLGVWASASTMQKLTMRQAAMRNLMCLRIQGISMLLFESSLLKIPRYPDAFKLRPDAFGLNDALSAPFQNYPRRATTS
jgi:hypothetical protein